ncbi:mtrA [Symbiodinium necroappetens]|uniref:MtrA protein n=1 Tax=Symbiodinium necroappetens TaxID=1628268 RepID=A0A813A4S7_9DINO|nr:mtrA [Symbiodinium necroappetens]
MLQLLLATKTRQELLQDTGDAHGAALTRSLTTWDLLAIGVGSTVGTGVFSITSQVAAQQAGPAVLLCWCAGGAGCMLSALAYMELSARLPVAGSVYAFAYHALGEVFAVVGAGCITLEYGISASAVAANWGDKFRTLVASLGAPSFASHLTTKIGPATLSLPALVVLLLVTALVYVGGDLGKRFARVSSALAVLLILLMVRDPGEELPELSMQLISEMLSNLSEMDPCGSTDHGMFSVAASSEPLGARLILSPRTGVNSVLVMHSN